MISRRHSGKGGSAAPKLPSGADGSPILTNRRPLRHRVPGQRPASCHSSVMRIGFDGSDHSPGRIRSAGHRMRQSDSVPCSYSCRSRFVAARALMIWILPLRSVKLTSNSRYCVEWPTIDLPLFACRVVRVVEDPGQRIREYGERFPEADAVFPGVGVCLHGLPFEIDAHRHRSRRYHDAIRRTAVPTRFQRPVGGPAERVDSRMFTADGA